MGMLGCANSCQAVARRQRLARSACEPAHQLVGSSGCDRVTAEQRRRRQPPAAYCLHRGIPSVWWTRTDERFLAPLQSYTLPLLCLLCALVPAGGRGRDDRRPWRRAEAPPLYAEIPDNRFFDVVGEGFLLGAA
jgi:hypothetical protein